MFYAMHGPIKMHSGSSLLVIFNVIGKFHSNTKFPENLQH